MAKILYPYPETLTLTRAREIHTARMCDALALSGHDVTWLIGRSDNIDKKRIINHFRLSAKNNLKIIFAPRVINFGPVKMGVRSLFFNYMDRLIKENNYDMIYCIHLKAASHILRSAGRSQLLFEAHEIFSDAYPINHPKAKSLHKLEKHIYPRVDLLVTTSRYLQSEIESRFGSPVKSLVAFNAVEDFKINITKSSQGSHNTGIYVGSFISWKGVDILIKAWKNIPDKKLILCGGSTDEIIQYQELATRLGIAHRVIFLGHRSRHEIEYWLSKAKVAIVPNTTIPKSSLYSFPMKILEYCVAGKTIVASAIPVVQEISPFFDNLLLFTPDDPNDLSTKIMQAFLSDRPTQFKQSPHQFSWHERANRVNTAIKTLITESTYQLKRD